MHLSSTQCQVLEVLLYTSELTSFTNVTRNGITYTSGTHLTKLKLGTYVHATLGM